MDLATFLINIFNKIEPTTESSQSLLRVSLSNQFSEQSNIMEQHKKAVEINEKVQSKIENLSFDMPEAEYLLQQRKLSAEFVPLPKVTLFTRAIALFDKPMMRLFLYFVFIVLSGWLTKRFMNKGNQNESEQDEEEEDRRPSKKERKILKKYNSEYIR